VARGYKTGGSGRTKGTPNKDTAQIRDMIIGALQQVGGTEYLARQALENPASFMTLVGKVLPTQLIGDGEHPIQFVIRGPSPVESASDWLKAHAPQQITIDADETIIDADETIIE